MSMDVELAAQGAVTPTFTFANVGRSYGVDQAYIMVQTIRKSGTTINRFDLEGAVILPDGGIDTFTSIANWNHAANAGSRIERRWEIQAGLLYRILYQTASTNRVRVLINLLNYQG